MRIILLFILLQSGLYIQAQQAAKQDSYILQLSNGVIQLQQYDDSIIRISFRPVTEWQNTLFSEAVIAKPIILKSGSGNTFQSGAWKLISDSAQGIIEIFTGSILPSLRLRFFSSQELAGFRFDLSPGEKIYGGGERATPLNRRGYKLPFYNNPWYGYSEGADMLNFSVPFLLSSRGYALFFDNPSRGYADVGKTDSTLLEAGFSGGELNVYVIAGQNMDQQVKAFSKLTGRQPLPPRWALGNFISRFGYTSQEQVLNTVRQMQRERFPVDAVILDLFWFGDSIKGTMGNLDWNKMKWPDPKAMIDTLKKRKIKTILITEPFILKGTSSYEESLPFLAVDSVGKPYMLKDFYFGTGGLVDLFRKDARDWFWKKYDKQIRIGVAGWWGDLGEPEKHPSDLYHNVGEPGMKKLVRSDEVHNIYGHYWSKMLAEKYGQFYPATRLFYLNRAGFAGSARYGIFPWTGDVSRSWSGLRSQLPLLQGMSISGIPFIHSDAGGFAGGEKDPELYTRWLQFAVFTPVFRPHGTMLGEVDPSAVSIPSEPVFWPDSTKEIVRKYIQLRYDLLPYNYTLAYDQTNEGKPLIRPMNYYNYADSNLQKATDQYMWGDALLVAPVIEKSSTKRSLYLPEGEWYNFFTNRSVTGGQWLDQPVNINNIPVFVKSGSFVPTRPGLNNVEEYKTRFLVVNYYLSQEPGRYTMYDDDGKDPLAYSSHKFERIGFKSDPQKEALRITVGSDDNRYEGRTVKKLMALKVFGLHTRPAQVKIEDLLVPYQNRFEEAEKFKGRMAFWDPVNEYLIVVFEYTGASQKIKISY
jgi:oligosaccharide 4-alpha-D-glucosyltransferase